MALSLTAFRIVAIAILTCFCSGVFAQETPRKSTPAKPAAPKNKKGVTWDKEPDSFMGIKFGEPLLPQVPECPKKSYGMNPGGDHREVFSYESLTGKDILCISNRDPNPLYPRWELHLLDIGVNMWDEGHLLLVDGKFEGLFFSFNRLDISKMYDLFLSRYGKPTGVSTTEKQTLGGANFSGKEYKWAGKHVTILIMELGHEVGQSQVFIMTNVYTDKVNDRSGIVKGKDKL